jgi:ABC-2 type transport system ATP-binding protein
MLERPAIEISGLTKRYKSGVVANLGVDLSVPRGTVFGLLGPNGAGKTTLVRQLTGDLATSSGEVRILGIDIMRHPIKAKALMGIVPQEAAPFGLLTVAEHLSIFARLHGLSSKAARARAEELLRDLGLIEHRSKLSSNLSFGLTRKLLVGIALVGDPQVLVLDEPTTGLDVTSRREVWSLIRSFQAKGASILLTTHYMEEAEALCNRVAIIDHGVILVTGTLNELRSLCRQRFKVVFEENGERRTLYGEAQQDVVHQIEKLNIVEFTVSKTNLEDVYIELTGQRLDVSI